jgi:hypothetical protein
MNSLEALLRREREHGRRESTVSWYVEGWLIGEDPDEGENAFETGEGLAPNDVAPNRNLRLRMSGWTDKDPDPSMLNETRAEVRSAGTTSSSGWDAYVSATLFRALQRPAHAPSGRRLARRSASHHGRKEVPC